MGMILRNHEIIKHPVIKQPGTSCEAWPDFFRGSSGLILWKRYGFPETKSEHKKTLQKLVKRRGSGLLLG